MRVHLTTLGCRLNEAEVERWSRDFRARGHELARGPGEADLVVVRRDGARSPSACSR